MPPELLETVGRLSGRFDETATLRGALEGAGFRDVTVERMHADLSFESAEEWWEWTWSGGFRAFLEAMPEDAQERYRAEAFERLEGAAPGAADPALRRAARPRAP